MTNWHKRTLGELCTFRAGVAFKTADQGQQTGEMPFIKVSDMNLPENTVAIRAANNWVDHEFLIRTKAKPFPVGTTVFAKIGEALRQNRVRKIVRPTLIDNNMMGAIPNLDLVSPAFLYYRLASFDIASTSTGTALPYLTVSTLERQEFLIPPLDTQNRITPVLSTYDDLIENNTRRIAILEEMARRIYEEWFIRFRFPGHEKVKMVESELGLIPEGWHSREVKDIVVRLPAGQVFKEADVKPSGQIPVVDQSTSELLGFHDEEAAHIASANSPVVIFGDHTCKMQLMVTPFSLGPNTVPFVAKEFPVHYVYSLVRGLVTTREYKRHWSDLMKKKVLVAHKEIAEQFSDTVRPMSGLIESLRRKNRNLRATRDLLLPKLISGELDVSKLPEPEAIAA